MQELIHLHIYVENDLLKRTIFWQFKESRTCNLKMRNMKPISSSAFDCSILLSIPPPVPLPGTSAAAEHLKRKWEMEHRQRQQQQFHSRGKMVTDYKRHCATEQLQSEENWMTVLVSSYPTHSNQVLDVDPQLHSVTILISPRGCKWSPR